MNEEELAAIREALEPKRSLADRVLTTRRKLAAAGVGLASVAGGLGLASLGVDGHLVIHGLFVASPVLLAGVVGTIGYLWRQNYVSSPLVDPATTEPGHMADPADLAWPTPAEDVTSQPTEPIRRPAALPSVTVTVHPLPESRALEPIRPVRAKEDPR